MKRYAKYKDSGVEWIGDIPEGWFVKKGKWLYYQVKRDVRENDAIVTCFRDGQVTLRNKRKAEGYTNALKEIGYQGIRKGDLVIHNMDAFAGAIGVSDADGKSTPVYSVCQPINVKEVNSYYYSYFLRELARKGYIQSLSRGIRERSSDFRFNDFASLPLPLPPLKEQEQIVAYLDEKTSYIDNLLDISKRKIGLLKEQRASIINQVITKGLNPNAKMKHSGVEWIGDIPEGWGIAPLKRFCNVKRGSSPRPIDDPKFFDINGQYSWVRISDVTKSERYLLTTDEKLSELGSSLSTKLEPDDLFLSIAGSVGKPIITKIQCCIHDGFVWFLNLTFNKEYLYYIFKIGQCFSGLGKMGTQLNLNSDTVGMILLPLPPLIEQEQIVAYLDEKTSTIDKSISIEERRIGLLKEYRQSIISQVITGKIKVIADE